MEISGYFLYLRYLLRLQIEFTLNQSSFLWINVEKGNALNFGVSKNRFFSFKKGSYCDGRIGRLRGIRSALPLTAIKCHVYSVASREWNASPFSPLATLPSYSLVCHLWWHSVIIYKFSTLFKLQEVKLCRLPEALVEIHLANEIHLIDADWLSAHKPEDLVIS